MTRRTEPVTRLIQHDHQHDPWRVLACCILLNRTGRKQVRSVLDEFFARWPDAASAAGADAAEMAEVTRPLGFYNRRSVAMVRFSREYLEKEWTDPRQLHGIGLYGWEAYRIVCLGDTSLRPTDKVLARYLEYVGGRGADGTQKAHVAAIDSTHVQQNQNELTWEEQ